MRESTVHRRAFDRYWSLGAERSIERLQQELACSDGRAPSLRSLFEWSRRFRWQDRLVRLETEARQAEDVARVSALRAMHARHASEAVMLQQRAAEWLLHVDRDIVSADSAIRALVEGARLERLARGEPTGRQEVVNDVVVTARIQSLTDDELDRLLNLANGTLDRAHEA